MNELRDLIREASRPHHTPPEGCLPAERLIAFYRGVIEGPEAEAMREHLATCPACLELARDARTFLAAMRDEATSEASPGALPRRAREARRWVAAAALVLVAGLSAWGWVRHERARAWRGLTIAKADYPLPATDEQGILWRGGDEEPADDYVQAMDSYLRGDYAAAESRLAAYSRQHPQNPDAELYRGVSLLLLGRTEEAISPLAAAVERGLEPVASEARWYLAQAYLASGETSMARRELERLETAGHHRSPEAKALLQRIGVD